MCHTYVHKKRINFAGRALLFTAWCAVALATTAGPGVELRLTGERMSLKSNGEQISRVLKEFSRQGVAVKMDPSIHYFVNASYTNEPIESVAQDLFRDLGYVMTWDIMEGPLGQINRLSEIQLFLPGNRNNVQELSNDRSYTITRAPLGGEPFVADEFLIGMRPGTTADEFMLLLNQIGGSAVDSIPELGIYRIKMPRNTNIPALLEQLRKRADVAAADANYVVNVDAPGMVSPPDVRTRSILEGETRLAILDSGVDLSLLPGNTLASTYDALNPELAISDEAGHGTHMALIAAGMVTPEGAGDSSEAVPLVAIKAFDQNGYASYYGLINGLTHAINEGAEVVNMSWGSTTDSEFLRTSVAYAQQKGVLLVAAAGNEPSGENIYPSAYPGVLAVAAANGDGTPWESSNYGDHVLIMAPGKASISENGQSRSYAGTSIASVYAARAISLYLARNPEATQAEAVEKLLTSLSPISGEHIGYGNGLLDEAAIKRFLDSN